MKVGLALSGGGARGVAHLGVIKALEENGIKPNIVSGVSSGAIIGALYCSGLSPEQILDVFIKVNIYRFLRPAWSRNGFLNIQKLKTLYDHYLPYKIFAELKIELIVSAVDIQEGKSLYFSQGDLIKCVMASSCMPVVFEPLQLEDKFLVDGGVLNNLPVEPLIGHCDLIVGVHCNPTNKDYKLKSMRSMIERTFHLAINNNVKERLKYCDLFIEPPKLANYGLFDMSKAAEIYKIGYEHALDIIIKSEEILEKYNIQIHKKS